MEHFNPRPDEINDRQIESLASKFENVNFVHETSEPQIDQETGQLGMYDAYSAFFKSKSDSSQHYEVRKYATTIGTEVDAIYEFVITGKMPKEIADVSIVRFEKFQIRPSFTGRKTDYSIRELVYDADGDLVLNPLETRLKEAREAWMLTVDISALSAEDTIFGFQDFIENSPLAAEMKQLNEAKICLESDYINDEKRLKLIGALTLIELGEIPQIPNPYSA